MRAWAIGKAPCPAQRRAALEILSLPMFPSLTDDEQDRVCDAVRDVVSGV